MSTDQLRTTCRPFAALLTGILIVLTVGVTSGAEAGKVELRDDGVMLLDGRAQLVYGAFRDPSDDRQDFAGLKSAGFNLTHSYYFENFKVDSSDAADRWIREARQYLRDAEAAGVGVFMGFPRNLVFAGDTQTIQQLVEAIKDEPALWFWYTLDEPLLQMKKFTAGSWHETLTQIYEAIRQRDTDHPVVVVDSGRRLAEATPQEVQAHGGLCDAIWIDTYQVPYSVLRVGRDVALIRQMLPGLTVWAVPEGGAQFPFTQWHLHQNKRKANPQHEAGWFYPKPRFDDRLAELEFTPDAIAAQFFGSWIAGARGAVFYWPPKWSQDIQNHTPKIWQAYLDLGQTIDELGPMLLEAQPTDALRVAHDHWGYLLRQDNLLPESLNIDRQQMRQASTALHWAGTYDGAYWVVVAVDYAPVQGFQINLPSAFTKITQYPGGHVIATAKSNHETDIDWDRVVGYIRKVREDHRSLQVLLGELDVLIWRIDTQDGVTRGQVDPAAPPHTEDLEATDANEL